MSDFALSRLNMVESQVRPSDVTDRRISRAMLALPRESFVPEAMKAISYMDRDLVLPPSAEGAPTRVLLAPRVLAKMIQAMVIGENAIVLDVACATGYSSAVLASLAKRVVAVESDEKLVEGARNVLAELEIDNVDVHLGSLRDGLPERGPFDAILVNGMVDSVPEKLLDQLKDGGRLVAILASSGVGRATTWLRVGNRSGQSAIFDASAPKLPEFEEDVGFVF